MNEGAATLSYLWQVPGKRVSVRISLDVVDQLDQAVMEGFQSLPRRGLETGGLLLGRARRSGETIVVDIDNFEPLECEHAVGPSYFLSAFDRMVLEDRIRRHKTVGGLSLVGFYRSNTRKDFALTVEDVDFMSDYFPEASNVFLLIHAHRDGPPTAGFAIWEGRKIRSITPYLEFPFRKSVLMAGAHQLSSRASAIQPAPEPRKQTQPALALPRIARLRGAGARLLQRSQVPVELSRFLHQRRARWRVELLAAAVIAVMGVLAAVSSRGTASPAAPVPLGLWTAHEGSGVRLLWDRSAPVVRAATRAVLWIGDGTAQTKLDIDPKQLSGGSIVYWPRNANISFRMEIFAPNLSASGSLATAGIHKTPPEASPELLKAAAAPAPAPVTSPVTASATMAPEPEIMPVTAPPAPVYKSAAVNRGDVVDQGGVVDRGGVVFKKKNYSPRANSTLSGISVASTPRSTVAAVPRMPVFPDPPEMAAGPVRDTEALLSENTILRPRPPEISDPFVSVTVDSLPESRHAGLLGRLIGKRPKHTDFVPPAPLREAPTIVPPDLRQRTRHEVPVDVKLYVDRAGKVEYAELLSKGTGPDRDLASLAVFSSRRWQFKPARLGDESVPAEVVLRFRFGPEVH